MATMKRLAALPLLLCSLTLAQEGRRCATPLLTSKILADLKSGAMLSGFQTQLAAGRVTANPAPRQAHSEHFTVAWMPSGSASRDTIATGMDIPLAGDTVPESIRLSLTALEDARRLIVDSLGMRPPLPAPSSWHWGIAPVGGRFVVEMLKVDGMSFVNMLDPGLTYFALTLPRGDAGLCNLAVASDWTSGKLPGWSLLPDTATSDTHKFGHDFGKDWRAGLAATMAHELMHAAQFRYERPVLDPLHFFYEASAVAFEDRATPWTLDWPQYARYVYSLSTPLNAVDPWYAPYGQGLFVQSLALDCPTQFQGTFWADREARGGNVMGTLERLSQGCAGDVPSLMARHSLRLMASGRRSGWLPQSLDAIPLNPFRMAPLMPSLRHDTLRAPSVTQGQFLSNPRLSFDYRTIGPQGATTAVVLATPTRRLLTLAGSDALDRGEEFLLLPPSAQPRWIGLVNPTSDEAPSWLGSTIAPDPDTLPKGVSRTWTLDRIKVAGTATDSVTARLWDCIDCWVPQSSDAFFSSASDARIHRIYDFHSAVRLHSATIGLPLPATGTGKVYRLNAASWTPMTASIGPNTLDVFLDTLDLRTPATFLVVAGIGSASAWVEAPYPNPLRMQRHDGVRFRMRIWNANARLAVYASDGALVASLRPQEGSSEIVWNARTASGKPVAPGLYFYRWSSARGAVEGRLLVGY